MTKRRTFGFLLAGTLLTASALGHIGCDGLNGAGGAGGTNGANGATGPQGPAGPTGATGPQGPKGDPGMNGTNGVADPSLSAVTPAAVPGARSAMLVITGVGSHFKAGVTTVDFGDTGITVTMVDVGSATNLRVLANISAQAMIGAHNVVVTTAGAGVAGANEVLTLQGGLVVQATLLGELPAGLTAVPTVPQGGIARAVLRNLDYRQNPFDNVQTKPIAGLAPLVGLAMPSPIFIDSTTYGGQFLVDALAPVGGLGIGLATTNPLGQSINFMSDPKDANVPQVTKRDATALTLTKTIAKDSIPGPLQTSLYKFTSPADNYVGVLNLANLGPPLLGGAMAAQRIEGQIAPTTGRFAEGLPFDTSVTLMGAAIKERNGLFYLPKMGDYYVALYTDALDGSVDHYYDIMVKAAVGTNLTLKEVNSDTPGAPLVTNFTLDKPFYGVDGAIDVAAESDYILFTPAKTGRVMVSVANNNGVPIGVGLYAMNCTTTVATGTAPRVVPGASSVEASLTMGNQYCVRVTGSAKTTYQLVLTPDLP